MKRRLLALVLLAPLALTRADERSRTWVTILSTTDLHGHITPVDYFTNQPAEYGLAKIATLVRDARKDNPAALLIDCGDTIQGSPMAYVHARRNSRPVDPMMLAMNALGYDAMVIGNHEYNFGLSVLEKSRGEASFPWLSANTYLKFSEGRNVYPTHLIKEVDGVRIGIVGLTTPAIPNWEEPANYAGLEFHDTLAEAAKRVHVLREKEHVDLVVVAMHMGIEYDLRTHKSGGWNLPGENAAVAIAEQVPGIDVILMGHTHRDVPALFLNGVLLTQAGRWGDRLARVDVYLDPVPGGRWTVAAKSARTIAASAAVTADAEITELIAPYEAETQAWLGKTIGTCAAPLDAREARLRDTALLDLIQRVQLDVGGADVSMAASFNPGARLAGGPVTVRDIAGLYVYENTLCVIEVTGAQLKDALEHAARYFLPYTDGATAAELIDPAIPGYNFDVAEGVDYTIDLTRAPGDRIVGLSFQGELLDGGRKLRLAINNYRLNGGGGYTMYTGVPLVFRSSIEIRELIIDWVEKHGDVPAEPTNNWRILPEAASAGML